MKTIILSAIFILFATLTAYTQSGLIEYESSKIDFVKVGTKLIYEVDNFGNYYFTAKIIQLKPHMIIDWRMTQQENLYGRMTISSKAL